MSYWLRDSTYGIWMLKVVHAQIWACTTFNYDDIIEKLTWVFRWIWKEDWQDGWIEGEREMRGGMVEYLRGNICLIFFLNYNRYFSNYIYLLISERRHVCRIYAFKHQSIIVNLCSGSHVVWEVNWFWTKFTSIQWIASMLKCYQLSRFVNCLEYWINGLFTSEIMS